jgi:hypothetical protein
LTDSLYAPERPGPNRTVARQRKAQDSCFTRPVGLMRYFDICPFVYVQLFIIFVVLTTGVQHASRHQNHKILKKTAEVSTATDKSYLRDYKSPNFSVMSNYLTFHSKPLQQTPNLLKFTTAISL